LDSRAPAAQLAAYPASYFPTSKTLPRQVHPNAELQAGAQQTLFLGVVAGKWSVGKSFQKVTGPSYRVSLFV
jgi:hypothetical protein